MTTCHSGCVQYSDRPGRQIIARDAIATFGILVSNNTRKFKLGAKTHTRGASQLQAGLCKGKRSARCGAFYMIQGVYGEW